jgi:predicted ATPase
MQIRDIQHCLDIATYNRDKAEKALEAEKAHLTGLNLEYDLAQALQAYVKETATYTLETISVNVSKIVTDTLKFVFDSDYKFVLDFNVKYGNMSCSMYLYKGEEIFDIRNQNGDGIADMVAIALRVAVLCMDKRKLRRTLILDEPAGAVSTNYQPMVGKLLEYLSKTLGIQIIMIAAHGANYGFTEAKCFDSEQFTSGAVL